MNKIKFLVMAVLVVFSAILMTACGEKTTSNSKDNTISKANDVIINDIDVMANAKILADSKVIDKEELPAEIKYIAYIKVANLNLDMISQVYTKSDSSKEEFDVLHDYNFLFLNEENSAKISLCMDGTPLRDYFFQSEEVVSNYNGIFTMFYKFKNKYIARFEKNGISFDIETSGVSEEDMLSLVKEVMK